MTDRDIVTRLRAVLHNDRSVELMNREAADEIERLHRDYSCICNEMRRMMKERDEARQCLRDADRRMGRLVGEIGARVNYGVDSNGHLDAIWNLWKEGRL
jgi:uncharacterized protein (DUF849 family)